MVRTINMVNSSSVLVISVLFKTSSVVKSIPLNAAALIKASSMLVLIMLVNSLTETSNMLKTSM